MSEPLSWTLSEDGLLELWLHRPPLNELGEESLAALERFVATLGQGGVRGVLVTSRLERGFCAGADLRALHEALAESGPQGVAARARGFVERIHAALLALDEAPLPTVAAVHGAAFGGGLELALCCDLIVADRTARFAFPELRLGLIPGFGGLPRLARDLGNARLRDLLLTGRSVSAETAQQWGLVHQVVAPGKHVEVARRLLRQTLKLDPQALAAAKQFAKPSPREALAEEVERFCALLARPEVGAALARFVAREDPLPWVP